MNNQIQLARGRRVIPSELTGIAATTTSNRQDSKGHNAIIIYTNFTAGSGTFTVSIKGRSPEGDYIDMYDYNGAKMEFQTTSDRAQFFIGLPEDFKLVVTEDVNGATATVSYELMTV